MIFNREERYLMRSKNSLTGGLLALQIEKIKLQRAICTYLRPLLYLNSFWVAVNILSVLIGLFAAQLIVLSLL